MAHFPALQCIWSGRDIYVRPPVSKFAVPNSGAHEAETAEFVDVSFAPSFGRLHLIQNQPRADTALVAIYEKLNCVRIPHSAKSEQAERRI